MGTVTAKVYKIWSPFLIVYKIWSPFLIQKSNERLKSLNECEIYPFYISNWDYFDLT